MVDKVSRANSMNVQHLENLGIKTEIGVGIACGAVKIGLSKFHYLDLSFKTFLLPARSSLIGAGITGFNRH